MHKSRATRLRRTAQVTTRCQASATPVAEANGGLPLPHKPFFKLGEVVRLVGAPAHVLRYWEKEIPGLRPSKIGTQQRRYRRADVLLLCELHRLLYKEKYTLAGAKRQLAAAWAGEPTGTYGAAVTESGPAVLTINGAQSARAVPSDPADLTDSAAFKARAASIKRGALTDHAVPSDSATHTAAAVLSGTQANSEAPAHEQAEVLRSEALAHAQTEVLRSEALARAQTALLRTQALQRLRKLAEALVEAAQINPE